MRVKVPTGNARAPKTSFRPIGTVATSQVERAQRTSQAGSKKKPGSQSRSVIQAAIEPLKQQVCEGACQVSVVTSPS